MNIPLDSSVQCVNPTDSHPVTLCFVSVDAKELHRLTPIVDGRIVSCFPLELYPHSIQPEVARYNAYNIAALYMFVLITIGSPFR
jgi:hypothetical protein